MTQSEQIRDDISFVRQLVAQRDDSPRAFAPAYYIWAVYVLVGYCLLDVNQRWANWFFLLAWVPAAAATGIARHFWMLKHGERNEELGRKFRTHFLFGGLLSVAAVIGLSCCAPGFRGPVVGQVMVILFGVVYFLAGVHLDRSFLWLGPVLIAGGIVVGLVPHYGWSALGAVIAGGLCAAAAIGSRRGRLLTSEPK